MANPGYDELVQRLIAEGRLVPGGHPANAGGTIQAEDGSWVNPQFYGGAPPRGNAPAAPSPQQQRAHPVLNLLAWLFAKHRAEQGF